MMRRSASTIAELKKEAASSRETTFAALGSHAKRTGYGFWLS